MTAWKKIYANTNPMNIEPFILKENVICDLCKHKIMKDEIVTIQCRMINRSKKYRPICRNCFQFEIMNFFDKKVDKFDEVNYIFFSIEEYAGAMRSACKRKLKAS